jgi:jumonji domain-containing protein 7
MGNYGPWLISSLADAIVDDHFVMPHEETMTFSEVLDHFPEAEKDPSIQTTAAFYVQSQNNNMKDEFKSLLEDVPSSFSWADSVLQCHPDAINFWLGDSRSLTTLHKDQYENLYFVVAGQKTFTM